MDVCCLNLQMFLLAFLTRMFATKLISIFLVRDTQTTAEQLFIVIMVECITVDQIIIVLILRS